MFALSAARGRFWSSDCSVSMDFGRSVDTGAARGGVESYVFYDDFFLCFCWTIFCVLRFRLRCARPCVLRAFRRPRWFCRGSETLRCGRFGPKKGGPPAFRGLFLSFRVGVGCVVQASVVFRGGSVALSVDFCAIHSLRGVQIPCVLRGFL